MNGFGQRLSELVATRGSNVCVGIDPHPQVLTDWGLAVDVAGLERCARTMVETLGERAMIFKPQSAFFEAFGSAGIAVLERVLADIRAAGALALLDAKRGDLGSTMAGYARAYLVEDAPLAADAITLSPDLGFDSLAPAIDVALANGRGVFVLARTSNPESVDLQTATTADGGTVAQSIVDRAGRRNAEVVGTDALGPIGVVVGATQTGSGLDLSTLGGPVLAPGVGAQGASIADARALLTGPGLVLPNVSRSLMSAGPDVDALRTAFTALHTAETGDVPQS